MATITTGLDRVIKEYCNPYRTKDHLPPILEGRLPGKLLRNFPNKGWLEFRDDKIDAINEGAILSITNGYINLFRGNMRINIGKYGSYELVEDTPIEEVNTENNLSDKRYEQERRFNRYGGRGGGRGGYGGGRSGGYGGGRSGGGGYQRRRY